MPEIQMPKLSDTMTEGTLVAWKKKKGDKVSAGDVIAEIETDKATMEWESPEDGTLTEIYVEEGGKVEVGQRIAFIGEEGEAAPKEEKKAPEKKPEAPKKEEAKTSEEPKRATEKPTPAKAKEKETTPPQEPMEGRAPSRPKPSPAAAREEKTAEEGRVKASPVARRIAAELGVDLANVKGTGPEGRVTETDVRAASKSVAAVADRGDAKAQPKPAPSIKTGEGARINLSGMRKGIAERLVQSKAPVPHFYLNIDIDAGPLMEARAELKSAGEDTDTSKITVNDFVLKGAVMAAVKVPKVNASFDNDAIVQYADVDLGLAVAIDDGLLTPVIRAAQNKSLREISELAKDLANRARNKRMKPEEFQGGSFTVSNLGGMGIDSFSAIINPPQGFILAVGKINKMPVIDNCDQIVVGHRMSIWMSCDHRVIDGALGAVYLKELRHLLENPALLLV
ncbi:MAG: pyruvate dehydrogenase complex dihydrolipoamide acetyltransferase [Verrucomicrobia bacterium]|nr:MAG: pyruvate dehydrogenase complex dihydrolipoamide acetyltransferase [Verrucomicrobiota bacterium]PYL75840.1 MAG: pyruvate dehydrogenase complex dihydrolipoamide acetyltransferase [Verrucomicrobiota bacterium]